MSTYRTFTVRSVEDPETVYEVVRVSDTTFAEDEAAAEAVRVAREVMDTVEVVDQDAADRVVTVVRY